VVTRALAVVAVLALATPAHADNPKLEQARKAIDEVRFDDAQRLLVGALADGGNSPSGVREIYKLSASTRSSSVSARSASSTSGAARARCGRGSRHRRRAQAARAVRGRPGVHRRARPPERDRDLAVDDRARCRRQRAVRHGDVGVDRRRHTGGAVDRASRAPPVGDESPGDRRGLRRSRQSPDRAADRAARSARRGARPGPRARARGSWASAGGDPRAHDRRTFLSTSSDAWAVIVDRRPACTTPCSLQLAARQYVGLRNEESGRAGRRRLSARRQRGREGHTEAEGPARARDPLHGGLGGGDRHGISLTAVGCSQELGGLCLAA